MKASLSLASDICSMTTSKAYYHIMYNTNHVVNKVASFFWKRKKHKTNNNNKNAPLHIKKKIHFSHQTMFHMLNILFTREKHSKTSHYALRTFSPKGCFYLERQAGKVGHAQIWPVQGQQQTIDSLQAASPTFCLP